MFHSFIAKNDIKGLKEKLNSKRITDVPAIMNDVKKREQFRVLHLEIMKMKLFSKALQFKPINKM